MAVVLVSAGLVFIFYQSPPQNVIVVISDSSLVDFSQFGLSIKNGASFAESNSAKRSGGPQLRIKFISEGSEARAAQIALEVAADKEVLAVIGHTTSGTSSPALEVYGPAGLPLFMPVATAPDLTTSAHRRGWNSVFRLVPSDHLQASKIASFARLKCKARQVVLVNDSTPYGKSLGNLLEKELGQQNIRVLRDEVPSSQNTARHIRELCDSIRHADTVVFAGYDQDGERLIHGLRNCHFKGPIILSDGCIFMSWSKFTVDPGEVHLAFVAPDWTRVDRAHDLVAHIAKTDNLPTTRTSGRARVAAVAYAPYAADAWTIIQMAAQRAHEQDGKLTRKSLLAELQRTRKFAGAGLIAGVYQFDDSGDNLKARTFMYTLRSRPNNEYWLECTDASIGQLEEVDMER